MRSIRFFGPAALAVICFWATAALAREVTVVLKDKSEHKGELVADTPEGVTIRLSTGVEKRWPRDQIREVKQQALTLAEEFRAERLALNDTDLNKRYDLAKKYFDKKTLEAYKVAQAEVESILKANPEHPKAKLLKDLVADRIALAEKSGDTPPKLDGSKPTKPQDPGDDDEPPAGVDKPKLLTEEQINLIRVYEVDLDSRPRVMIPSETVNQFLEKYTRDPVAAEMKPFVDREGKNKFKTLEAYEQLSLMFDATAREFYPKVVIREEPETLKQFKQVVHNTYVVQYCGRCHGNGKARGLYVITSRKTADATVYTNLAILGHSESKSIPLIFKEAPERSPLLQFGMPKEDATVPHPDAPGYRPFFNGTKDPRYSQVFDWIASFSTDLKEVLPDFKLPAFAEKK